MPRSRAGENPNPENRERGLKAYTRLFPGTNVYVVYVKLTSIQQCDLQPQSL